MKKSTRLKTIILFDSSTRTIVKRENESLGVHCYVWIPKNKKEKPFIVKDVYGRQNIFYTDMEKGIYKTLKKTTPQNDLTPGRLPAASLFEKFRS